MFTKIAESAIIDIKSKPLNLFEELAQRHATEYAKVATLGEEDIRKQNYNLYRTIAEKKPNLLAFATRAISAYETWGPNKNGDAFERAELEKYYPTFFMRPHLLDHRMEIPYIRGMIAGSYWRPLTKTASNRPDGDYVETLIFVNRDDFPKYASMVENGTVNSFSMGVEVQEAECSHCHNIARNPSELCECVSRLKNLVVGGRKVFEFNRGLNFIEQSAVVSPADVDSHTLYILASVKNTAHQDVERLKKIASVLDSYSETEKQIRRYEYQMLEAYANQLADKIMLDLNILPRRPNL